MKNIFQAKGAAKHKGGTFFGGGTYPTIPAIWPNRAIRRALRYGKTLPSEWYAFFDLNPEHRALAKFQGTR